MQEAQEDKLQGQAHGYKMHTNGTFALRNGHDVTTSPHGY